MGREKNKRQYQANIIVLTAVLLISFGADLSGADLPQFHNSYRPGHALIRVTDGYTPSLPTLLPDIAFSELKAYDGWQVLPLSDMFPAGSGGDKSDGRSLLERIYLISFPDSFNVIEIVSRLGKNPDVSLAEPDYKIELFDWPGDPLLAHQWYLNNTAQQYYGIDRGPGSGDDRLVLKQGIAGEDIRIAGVYNAAPADKVEVIVGVIDTGIDYGHPDISENIYHNVGDIAGNGQDDDHNGLVDDSRGWDFSGDSLDVLDIRGDNDATDSIGHGTHVAGLVAAVNNQIGIASYPAQVKVLPVKIFPNGFVSVASAAVIYCADMGAKVINMSWGIPAESGILHEAIQYAAAHGALPIPAAGNSGDSRYHFPAAYPECLTVGGTNSGSYMTYFSSYGAYLDIVAPAQDILSLRASGTDLYAPDEPQVRIIDDLYYLADGTSMAAPQVSGAAAMLWSFQPGLDAAAVRQALEQSADDLLDPFGEGVNLPGYDTLSGWGRLNVSAALAQVLAPSAYIVSPRQDEILTAPAAIAIRVTGGYSGPADLSIGMGKTPTDWTLLRHTDACSPADTFYLWDINGVASGYFSFRLETTVGQDQIDVRVVNGTQAEISHPPQGAELRYLVDIQGSAYAFDYDSTRLFYQTDGSQVKRPIFSGTRLFLDEVIFEWPVSSLLDGNYLLVLEMFAGSQTLADSVSFSVRSLMRAGFPAHLPGYAAFSPNAADIDGDGYKEIVVGCAKGLFAFRHDGQILPGFPILSDRDMRSMPAFDDIDGDGLLDIVVTGQNIVGCYNYRGEALAGWPRLASTGMAYYSFPVPLTTELFDREDSVILYMSKYGEIRAYFFNGNSYFYSLDGLFTALDPNIFDTSQYVGLSVPYLGATDLDNSEANEVVAVYSTAPAASGIYIWNGRNGLPPFGWQSPLARRVNLTTGGILSDVNQDGHLDIIMCGTDSTETAWVWATTNGQVDLPGWPVRLPGVGDWIGMPPICADIDNNGSQEVLVTFFSLDIAKVFAFNSDGTPYIERPGQSDGLLLTTTTSLSSLIVADVDGNGMPNLLARGGQIFPGSGFERIFVWEPNGTMTPGFPLITPTPSGEVVSTPFVPLVDDLDNDGSMELIMSGDAGDLFVWDLEAPYDTTLIPWGRFRGDIRNSGINPDIGIPTDLPEDRAQLPERFGIIGNQPNPFNPTTTITFALPRAGEIKLDIYNILGQKIRSLHAGWLSAGVHQRVWDGNDIDGGMVATGIYLACLTQSDKSATRKLMMLK